MGLEVWPAFSELSDHGPDISIREAWTHTVEAACSRSCGAETEEPTCGSFGFSCLLLGLPCEVHVVFSAALEVRERGSCALMATVKLAALAPRGPDRKPGAFLGRVGEDFEFSTSDPPDGYELGREACEALQEDLSESSRFLLLSERAVLDAQTSQAPPRTEQPRL